MGYHVIVRTMPYKDKQKHLEYQREWRKKRRLALADIKDVPCADCGLRYPFYVMDFDHKNEQKLFKIASDIGKVSWQRILDEIAKCEVICANCHRIRWYEAKHHLNGRLTSQGARLGC